MHRSWLPNSVLLILILSACNSQSSSSAATKELQTINSWTATTNLLTEKWLQDAVPTNYATRTLQTAQKNLQEETNNLTKTDIVQKYPHFVSQLRQLQQNAKQISAAIAQGNKSIVTRQLQQLKKQAQEIRRFADSLEKQP